jgi:pyruvate dehydrogenase E2 component (dihydrolipoamide acetyltransferase)
MATEILMPRLSDSMEEGTIVSWLVAVGAGVATGETIAEVETDKATMGYEAETDGTLLAILVAEGETATVGAPIAIVGVAGEAPRPRNGASPPTDPRPAAVAAAAPAGSPAATARVAASPVARRLAQAHGIELRELTGSGPNGRVVKRDVERAVQAPTAPSAPPPPATVPSAPVDGASGEVRVVALSRSQQVVARRMSESRATIPDFEVSVDVDMGACVELRTRLKAMTDTPPSFNDMVVKASGLALREHPRANGRYRDGTFELRSRVNVGVAVAADDALVVPTVFDADRASLGEIARTTRALAAKVRDGSITPPELAGGTFSVSNLGMFGIDRFSAVINIPQAAILAVGAITRRVLVGVDDELVVRPVMTLSLSADHRILYGADAAKLLGRIRDLLEEPLSFAVL